MNIIQAIILGIIQGLTEFLPVSSSGHLELGKVILGVRIEDNLLFSVIVHGATTISTITVFRKDILNIIQDLFKIEWNESWKFVFKIIISMIPVTVVGLLFESQIESFFGGKIAFVGAMFLVTASLLILAHFAPNQKKEVNFIRALIMGVAQCIAILPGISRSGATISTGLLTGVDKAKVSRFSFLMVLPPILGATALKFKDYLEYSAQSSDISVLALASGFVAAFISGVFACKWMISLVKKGKLLGFGIYCFVIGVIVITISF